MQVYLRLGSKQTLTVRKIEDVFYNTESRVVIRLYPLPKWIKDPTCGCGRKGDFLIDGAVGFPVPICAECVNNKIPAIKLEKKEDISFPVTEALIRRLKFEWSTNGDRWYYIHGRSLKPNNWNFFLKKIKKVVLGEGFVTLEVDYKKETKEMRVF